MNQAPSQPQDFAGKRVLVTGGTRGMGRAIVALMQARCAQVITTAREASGELPPGVEFIRAELGTKAETDAVAGAILASQLAASIHGSEHVNDGGTIPTV